MTDYSITILDTESEPFQGVLVYEGKTIPFLIENLFDMWFKFESLDDPGARTKEFSGELYYDALAAMTVLQFKAFMEIRIKLFHTLFDKFGIAHQSREEYMYFYCP